MCVFIFLWCTKFFKFLMNINLSIFLASLTLLFYSVSLLVIGNTWKWVFYKNRGVLISHFGDPSTGPTSGGAASQYAGGLESMVCSIWVPVYLIFSPYKLTRTQLWGLYSNHSITKLLLIALPFTLITGSSFHPFNPVTIKSQYINWGGASKP